MSKFNFSNAAKTVKAFAVKRSPEILTGIGIAGMITTTIMAVRATPKALRLLESHREDDGEKLPAKTVIKTTWKCYIPAAVTGTMSVACLIGASSVNAKRNAALATAYTLSETALKEYKAKVVETIGEKKEASIRDDIVKERIEKDPVKNHEVIITEKGNTLCYDTISGRYFRSDIEKIRKAVNELNRRMISENYISLNEFYYEIGLRCTESGNQLGWNLDNGLIEPHFSSQLTEDGEPCLAISYLVEPRYDYGKLM